MKRVHGAVIGLMAMVLSGAAFAQGMYGGSTSSNQSNASNATATDISNSFKSSDLKGMSVENRQNQKLGSISDVIIDQNGKVADLVLKESGLRGQQYLVPWDRVQLTPGDKIAILDVNKDQLSSEFSAMEEGKGATGGKAKAKKKAKKSEKTEKSEKGMEEGGGKPSGSPGAGAPSGGTTGAPGTTK